MYRNFSHWSHIIRSVKSRHIFEVEINSTAFGSDKKNEEEPFPFIQNALREIRPLKD